MQERMSCIAKAENKHHNNKTQPKMKKERPLLFTASPVRGSSTLSLLNYTAHEAG
jgi:hypothetical protein